MAPCEFLDLDEENKMQESTIVGKDDNNIDLIYKDLLYTQERWILGEQVFPLWENIYAIIVSALYIIYFTSALGRILINQQIFYQRIDFAKNLCFSRSEDVYYP